MYPTDGISQEERNRRMTAQHGMKISNVFIYHDGFSCTVKTELEAYKLAHRYQGPGIERTSVSYSPNIQMWSVQVFKKE